MSLWFKIRGFQSIRNPIEVLVEGYCTIEGESNLGKSAVIRAFHAALSNRVGTEFITEDELSCDVVIRSLGHTAEWYKDRKATRYEVDGVKINKPGRGTVPDEIRALGLYPIRTLDKELHWPQIHFQWDQPFIIGSYTDTLAAELLGASRETLKIGRAIKLVNGDVVKCKMQAEVLETQHKRLVTTVETMEKIAEQLNTSQQVVDQIETVRNEALKRESTYRDLVGRYRSTWTGWKISSTVAQTVVPAILDVSHHEKLLDLHRRYSQACSVIETSSRGHGTVPDVMDGREHVAAITRLYKELNRVSQQIETTGQVVSLPEVQRPDGQGIVNRINLLKSLKEQFLKTQKEIDTNTRVMGEITTELKKIDGERAEIHHLVGSIERCPLCSAPMKNGVYCPDEAPHACEA